MNKMVINHIEKLFVTSDAGTIIRELDVSINIILKSLQITVIEVDVVCPPVPQHFAFYSVIIVLC